MEYQVLTVLAVFALVYSLVARRLERTPINGALVYVLIGWLCGPAWLKLVDVRVDSETISLLAELTLAVVLFTDSANAKLSVLRRFEAIPTRLLLIGLPLTILLGFGVGTLLFNDLGLLEIAILATLLAPTDAALGKAVVTNESVPSSVRESLNVESGLNDGICVPVLLLFLALAGGDVTRGEAVGLAAKLPLMAIGIGAVVGLALGISGSAVLRGSRDRGWIGGSWLQFPVVALALLCFALAQWLGGSGFIASFVGGMTFGALTKNHKEEILEAAEGTGDALAMLTWFAFGSLLFLYPLQEMGWRIIVYSVASLTVVRMIPVFLSVVGKGLRTDTKMFIGWFGPRGLASIVFGVMVLQAKLPGGDVIVSTAVCTILFSVIAHGMSANPLATAYGARIRDGKI